MWSKNLTLMITSYSKVPNKWVYMFRYHVFFSQKVEFFSAYLSNSNGWKMIKVLALLTETYHIWGIKVIHYLNGKLLDMVKIIQEGLVMTALPASVRISWKVPICYIKGLAHKRGRFSNGRHCKKAWFSEPDMNRWTNG